MKLYIVGEYLGSHSSGGLAWAFCGVFDTEAAAIEACTTPHHFYGPAALNERLPDETEVWPDLVYPHAENELT